MTEEAEKELDDTRIFGMTYAEFEALSESEKERLLPKLKLPVSWRQLEDEEQEDAESYDWCRSGW